MTVLQLRSGCGWPVGDAAAGLVARHNASCIWRVMGHRHPPGCSRTSPPREIVRSDTQLESIHQLGREQVLREQPQGLGRIALPGILLTEHLVGDLVAVEVVDAGNVAGHIDHEQHSGVIGPVAAPLEPAADVCFGLEKVAQSTARTEVVQ